MITPNLPERFVPGVKRYLEHGVLPGSFLRAVISNDLKGALGSADITSITELPGIVSWFYNDAPANCWGSPKIMMHWAADVRREKEEENAK